MRRMTHSIGVLASVLAMAMLCGCGADSGVSHAEVTGAPPAGAADLEHAHEHDDHTMHNH